MINTFYGIDQLVTAPRRPKTFLAAAMIIGLVFWLCAWSVRALAVRASSPPSSTSET